jgi:hypothetical protein
LVKCQEQSSNSTGKIVQKARMTFESPTTDKP